MWLSSSFDSGLIDFRLRVRFSYFGISAITRSPADQSRPVSVSPDNLGAHTRTVLVTLQVFVRGRHG